MTKQEFLGTLEECLVGNVSQDSVKENLAFYREYFESSNKSEEEVCQELGPPHVIAKTIIDSTIAKNGPMADMYTQQAREEYSHNQDQEEHERQTSGDKGFYFNGKRLKWYEKLLLILVGVLIVALVIVLAVVAIQILIQIVLPILIIVFIIRFVIGLLGKS